MTKQNPVKQPSIHPLTTCILLPIFLSCSQVAFENSKDVSYKRSEANSEVEKQESLPPQNSEKKIEKNQKVKNDEVADDPVPVGGAFLTCLADAGDKNIKNITVGCSVTDPETINWNKVTVEVGKEGNSHTQTEFVVTLSGFKFVWFPGNGQHVILRYAEQSWRTKIEYTLPPSNDQCLGFEVANIGCFYLSEMGDSCSNTCNDRGEFDFLATKYANAKISQCDQVLDGLDAPRSTTKNTRSAPVSAVGVTLGAGCGYESDPNQGPYDDSEGRWIIDDDDPTADASEETVMRACACR